MKWVICKVFETNGLGCVLGMGVFSGLLTKLYGIGGNWLFSAKWFCVRPLGGVGP